MTKAALIAAAALVGSAAMPSTSSALMHAYPGQSWVNCGRVLGHDVGVTQPGTSCALGRDAARVALRHHPSFRVGARYGPVYRVTAYSPVTHKRYHLRASGSYGMGELGIWGSTVSRITISVRL
jgi:hypothetical protein